MHSKEAFKVPPHVRNKRSIIKMWCWNVYRRVTKVNTNNDDVNYQLKFHSSLEEIL